MSNSKEKEKRDLYLGLKKTIQIYFEMYSLTKENKKFVKKEYYRSLSIEFGRTPKYYERRMSNISHVVVTRYGVDHLKGLKPLFGVGKNVENDIVSIIDKKQYISSNSIISDKKALKRKKPDQEANNDDITVKKFYEKKIRAGQQKFRNNLLINYKRRCVVSKCNVVEVLEAAHILKHSISGINHTSNGILLRRDIHKLFDNGLIKLNSESMKIEVDLSLVNTEYFKYDGKTIEKDKFGHYPKKSYLMEKYSE